MNNDSYCVFGNPIAHSKSPLIHARFAAQTRQPVSYGARLAPLEGFAQAVADFMAEGGKGANVTVPFKEEAYRLCQQLSDRARRAGAVNTLLFRDGQIHGDNTDGAGFMRDLEVNLGFSLKDKKVLLLGAGGAARGVLGPILDGQPAQVLLANRTVDKAQQLAALFQGPVRAGGYSDIPAEPFDLVLNATAASLSADLPPLPSGVFATDGVAYDMMYGKGDTPFLAFAKAQEVLLAADGLGMLVEQAAEAFLLWRGVRPETRPVLEFLRSL